MAQRSYTREEMEEILRRAAERTQRDEDAVRHDDLVAAAREVGIDPAAIDDALAEMGEQKSAEDAAARWTKEQRRRFASHFSAYAIVMTFLGSLNVLVTPHVAWALWIALAWGMGVAFSARRALLAPSERDVEKLLAREEKLALRKARREQQKQQAEAWRRRWQELAEQSRAEAEARKRRGSVLAQAEKEIDRAIEDGVNALVSALAKRARSAVDTLSGTPRTDFERYVAKQRQPSAPPSVASAPARPSPGPIVTPPPRTRVAEVEDDDDRVEEEKVRRRARR